MSGETNQQPAWINRGKTIRQLIKELQTCENQDRFVEISIDNGATHKPISLVGKKGADLCILEYCGVNL